MVNRAFLRRIFIEAVNKFAFEEGDNIANDPSERSSCGRLAMYLESVAIKNGMRGFYADVEYNRHCDRKIKAIFRERSITLDGDRRQSDEESIVNVTCDLIFHSRGGAGEYDNLIAVEMKKESSNAQYNKDIRSDRERLIALTMTSDIHPYQCREDDNRRIVSHFQIGYLLIINSNTMNMKIEEYACGRINKIYNRKITKGFNLKNKCDYGEVYECNNRNYEDIPVESDIKSPYHWLCLDGNRILRLK